jgi:hypothetical protein
MKKFVVVLAVVAMCGSVAQAVYKSGYDYGWWWSTWYDTASSFSISFSGADKTPALSLFSGLICIMVAAVKDGEPADIKR